MSEDSTGKNTVGNLIVVVDMYYNSRAVRPLKEKT